MNYTFRPELILRTPTFSLDKAEGNVDKVFAEALYLSSPDLLKILSERTGDKQSVANAVLKYRTRMRMRCTPFGLLAGCTVVEWGDDTSIQLQELSNVKRHTRLDMHYLGALVEQLSQISDIKNHLLYYPNSSLYKTSDKIRYIEYKYIKKRRKHTISSVDYSSYLQEVLEYAKRGKSITDLARILTSEQINLQEAKVFIEELIDEQLLVHELQPAITGEDTIDQIIEVLKSIKDNSESSRIKDILYTLNKIKILLNGLDGNIGNEISLYEDVSNEVKTLGIDFEKNRLFQVDMFKSTEEGVLSRIHQQTLYKTTKLLDIVTPTIQKSNIDFFKDSFNKRYENKEVSLLEALDSESGIGYLQGQFGSGDFNPLTNDLLLPDTNEDQQLKWTKWISYLHDKVLEVDDKKKYVLKLKLNEVKAICSTDNLIDNTSDDLPDTMAIMFSYLAGICDNGEDKIFFGSAGGSSAANLLGRFAHGDERIQDIIKEVVSKEDILNPEKILAEIVHLPENRTGNILMHPPFRKHEIPFLARSGVNDEYQIGLNDLYISVKNDKIVLRSKRLNKHIIPRLTNAHNFSFNALPVYQFLCDLQTQNVRGGLYFSWGELETMFSYLPRVEYDGVILSYATWFFEKNDFKLLVSLENERLMIAIMEFRKKHQLPKCIIIAEGDNELMVDLTDEPSVNMCLEMVKKMKRVKIMEFLFNSKSAIVRDTDDRPYTNEFIAILEKEKKTMNPIPNLLNLTKKVQRNFSLGSEWFYTKLYCGNKTADRILKEAIKPLVKELVKSSQIDQWFFIRYADPDTHLRLRFHLTDIQHLGEVITKVSQFLSDGEENGTIWKTQTDTYQREIERYGSSTVKLSEQMFYYDSEMIVNIIDMISGDEGEHIRWKFGVRAIDHLLDNFGYSIMEKKALMESLKRGFGEEFGMNRNLKKQLDVKFREERNSIEQILNRDFDSNDPLNPLWQLLQNKDQHTQKIVYEILAIRKKGELEVDLNNLLSSYIHMLLNRLFKSNQRMHEMVIYDFMFRHYRSIVARSSQKKKL